MLAATPAKAGVVSRVQADGYSALVYEATPGLRDSVQMYQYGRTLTVSTVFGEDNVESSVCRQVRSYQVDCDLSGIDLAVVDAGDGDDTVNASQETNSVEVPLVIVGGPGDDSLRGGAGDDKIDGNDGDDKIRDSLGADLMSGGENDDEFFSALASSGDVVQGDSGRDTAILIREAPYTVSLNRQPDDGVAGES